MPKRNLYLSNISVDEALERFKTALATFIREIKTEEIEVIHALGRITSEAVYAKCNSPLYNCAAMDGIAVCSAHTHGASETSPLALHDYVTVDTGDPIKPPYDAVIMAEDIQSGRDGSMIIRSAASPWQHIRPVGEDIVQGEMILPSCHTIRPFDIGVLLSGGVTRIFVRMRPRVAIIPTGTELIEPGDTISGGCIIESNSYMLEGLVRESGGIPTRFRPVPDAYPEIKKAISDNIKSFDMIMLIAGTSAGTEDYTCPALRELGDVIVHGVAMKPGKPVILAVLDGKPVIGIPGYPVSAYLAYEKFVSPVLAALAGYVKPENPVVRATLTRKLVSSLKHREYVRVKVGKVGGKLVVTPLARGAGAAMSLAKADGFCVIEQNSEGIDADSDVDIVLCRRLHELENTVVSIGSHDLIMDIIADLMRGHAGLSSTHVGSMGGLLALKNGEAHIAPFHLADDETGIYNLPILKKLLAGRNPALIKGVGRVQGIMVQKRNPLGIEGIEDLRRCKFINRQRGAGTRLFLDAKLKEHGILPSDISGYEREAATHMAVAAAVKNGSADAGLGIQSAATAMGLDFIPIGEEEYDFATYAEYLTLPHVRAFIEVLKSDSFHNKINELGGYTAGQCGDVIDFT